MNAFCLIVQYMSIKYILPLTALLTTAAWAFVIVYAAAAPSLLTDFFSMNCARTHNSRKSRLNSCV